MMANCESIFLNEQFIIMSSYSFLLYTKLTSIHYVVLGYYFIRIKNWEEWMKAFSIWHKGSFVFFTIDRSLQFIYIFLLFFEFFLNQYDSKLRIKLT